MFASVMNPSTDATGKQPLPSILPFFAQHDPMALELAALLAPRMPMVVGPPPAENLVPEDSDEEEDDDVMDTGHDDPFESNITSTPSWAHKRAYPEEQVAEQRTAAHPEVPKKPRVEEPEFTPAVAPSHVPATTSTPIATAPTVTSEAPAAVPFITPEMPEASVTSSVAETAAAATIPEKGASKPDSIFAEHPTSTANVSAARSSAFGAVADAASGKQAAGGEDEDEESGDEIPTLNVESDSDESMD
ncbi:hypothetical protein KEM55_001304 [Ascosphaera atra]|nr:hypothetical protein KEM55_001304 [Ascosphaera atra]